MTRTCLLHYLSRDEESEEAGELRHKLRQGKSQGAEVSSVEAT